MVAFKHMNRFEGDSVVHVDRVFCGCYQQVTTMGEQANARLSDGELMKDPHIVDEDVEETDLVGETRGKVEAIGMDTDAVDLLVELFGKLQSKCLVVPDPDKKE